MKIADLQTVGGRNELTELTQEESLQVIGGRIVKGSSRLNISVLGSASGSVSASVSRLGSGRVSSSISGSVSTSGSGSISVSASASGSGSTSGSTSITVNLSRGKTLPTIQNIKTLSPNKINLWT